MLVDIIIIAIIAFAAFRGYKLGLVHSILNFFGSFAAAIIAFYAHPIFKNFLIKVLALDKFILEKVVLKMKELGAAGSAQAVSSSDIDAMDKLLIPGSVKEGMKDFLTTNTSELTKSVALSVTDFIVSVIAFGLLFVSLFILFIVLKKLLRGAVKMPIINTLNNLGGLLFALISTHIVLTIVLMLINSFVTIGPSSFLGEQLASSRLLEFLTGLNPLLLMLSAVKVG